MHDVCDGRGDIVVDELLIIWALRIGFVLLLLGIFLPSKTKKKTILRKALRKSPVIFHNTSGNNRSKIMQYLDNITENSFIRLFMLSEDSKEYVRLEKLIVQAGGLKGLTPNIVQLVRIFLPLIAFVCGVIFYWIHTSVRTVQLNASEIQALLDTASSFQSFLKPQVVSVSAESRFNPLVIMWIFIGSLLLYFLPEFLIKLKIKKKMEQMRKELPILETFIIIMLEAGTHTVYDILSTLLDTTVFFKPYLVVCLNEYYINPKQAIQNMADKINDEEFQIICNGLKQAVDMEKRYTATFMQQHLDQLKKLQELRREANIKKKPLVYVFLLALPLFNIITIWFYPWFVNAMKLLVIGF